MNENNALRPDTLNTYVKGVLRANPKLVILHSSPGSVDLETLEEFGLFLKKNNVLFWVIAPIPQPPMNVPQYLYMNIKNHSRVTNFSEPNFSMETYYNQNEVELQALNRLSSSLNIHVVETVDLFCRPLCQIVNTKNLKPLYFDTSHLTKTGANLIINRIKEIPIQHNKP